MIAPIPISSQLHRPKMALQAGVLIDLDEVGLHRLPHKQSSGHERSSIYFDLYMAYLKISGNNFYRSRTLFPMQPIVISYFTRNTPYEKDAAHLKASCERVGLETSIEGIDSFGKWHEHVCYKPTFIHQKLKELKRPLLWVDADGELVQKPTLFSTLDCDLALRRFDHFPTDHPCYLFASTIYLNYNPATLSLTQSWAEGCHQALQETPDLEISDQVILQSLLAQSSIRFQPLPPGYAALFEEKLPPAQLFIVQHQASRLYKKLINQEVSSALFDTLSLDELRQLRPKLLL